MHRLIPSRVGGRRWGGHGGGGGGHGGGGGGHGGGSAVVTAAVVRRWAWWRVWRRRLPWRWVWEWCFRGGAISGFRGGVGGFRGATFSGGFRGARFDGFRGRGIRVAGFHRHRGFPIAAGLGFGGWGYTTPALFGPAIIGSTSATDRTLQPRFTAGLFFHYCRTYRASRNRANSNCSVAASTLPPRSAASINSSAARLQELRS